MNDLLNIENKIMVIRGQHVMLDRDLAEIYGVETKRLKEQVNRNKERFPEQFCFQLTNDEFLIWRSQIATSKSDKMGLRYAPYAFTEQGMAMLSAVLHSETAIRVSIDIMDAFVAMRRFLLNNEKIFSEINSIKQHLISSDIHQKESNQRIDTLFNLMDKYKIKDKQSVFVKGQIFDAYVAFQGLIQKAHKEIILIDNYIDLSVLERFTKKNPGVNITIYTRKDTPVTNLEITKFNAQYPNLALKYTDNMHDRFLILDNSEIYFIGASIKDLGKKCFGFMKMENTQLMLKTLLQAL